MKVNFKKWEMKAKDSCGYRIVLRSEVPHYPGIEYEWDSSWQELRSYISHTKFNKIKNQINRTDERQP